MTASTLLNRSFLSFTFILCGCVSAPVEPPRHQQPRQQQPQEQPRVVQPPAQQLIPTKTASNALSAPIAKPKPSLGLVVANHKTLTGALVLRHDSFKGVSPAGQAGIRKGDIITDIGACKVTNISTYFACIEKFQSSQEVEIAYDRDGVILKVRVKLGERFSILNPLLYDEIQHISSLQVPHNIFKLGFPHALA